MSHSGQGGAPSVDFQLDEFERAAALLGRAAERLFTAAQLIAMALTDTAPPVAGRGAAHSRAAEEHLWSAKCLAAEVADGVQTCRSGLSTSRATYEEAEREAARRGFWNRSVGVFDRLPAGMEANHGHPDRQATEDLINAAPGYGLAWLATGGDPPSDPVARARWRAVARLLADREHGGPYGSGLAERLGTGLVGSAILRQLLNLRAIHVVSIAKQPPEKFTGTIDDLMALQRRAEARISGEGAVLVTTTRAAHGTVHVLTLPGTQPDDDWRASSRVHPFDEGGIAEGIGLDSQYVGRAAADALREAGAQPGDRLVITGYSQGGIHAANLAADPDLLRDYDVACVVTAGAPVGGTPLPEDVRGLHLEHVDDMVPGLDGRPNPQTSNQVTVDFQGYAPGTDLDAAGFGAAHQLGNYSHLSRELASSTDPSVVDARTQLGVVFAGATTATVSTVKLARGSARPKGGMRRKPVPARRAGGNRKVAAGAGS